MGSCSRPSWQFSNTPSSRGKVSAIARLVLLKVASSVPKCSTTKSTGCVPAHGMEADLYSLMKSSLDP